MNIEITTISLLTIFGIVYIAIGWGIGDIVLQIKRRKLKKV
jgi:hypothetical protein